MEGEGAGEKIRDNAFPCRIRSMGAMNFQKIHDTASDVNEYPEINAT